MKILIGITTAETVCHETMESLFNLQRPENIELLLKIHHSYNVAEGRNQLVKLAFREGCSHIFFVDSDIILPSDALIKLLDANVWVINGTYPRKELETITNSNPFTTLYRHEPKGLNKINFGPFFMSQAELPNQGIIPVDAAGLGCTLIDLNTFRKLGGNDDWFIFAKEESQIHMGPYCLGEDLYFYRSCLRKDIQPYAEASIRCGHVGKMIYELKK